MPRSDQTDEKREKLLPIVARTFAECGYRRATTAKLAQRCKVRENILHRLWPDKKTMFLASMTMSTSRPPALGKSSSRCRDSFSDTLFGGNGS